MQQQRHQLKAAVGACALRAHGAAPRSRKSAQNKKHGQRQRGVAAAAAACQAKNENGGIGECGVWRNISGGVAIKHHGVIRQRRNGIGVSGVKSMAKIINGISNQAMAKAAAMAKRRRKRHGENKYRERKAWRGINGAWAATAIKRENRRKHQAADNRKSGVRQ